jgi:hypothetical protein
VTIGASGQAWAYYGCYLNIYPLGNTIGSAPVQTLLPSSHSCVVAQLVYDDAPAPTGPGVQQGPEYSDNFAQRNLEITYSDNPGPAGAHRVPQTFDARPGPAPGSGQLENYPDELMIDWGDTPVGSVASIYWPGVAAADVLALAKQFYSILSTRQPWARSTRLTFRSRARFPFNFHCQNPRLCRGCVPCFGQPCQKHASTKTATRRARNVKSGFPNKPAFRRQPDSIPTGLHHSAQGWPIQRGLPWVPTFVFINLEKVESLRKSASIRAQLRNPLAVPFCTPHVTIDRPVTKARGGGAPPGAPRSGVPGRVPKS